MSDSPQPYRVLARKYRPRSFSELIGQDAMVQTLGNAIRRGRLAHAFLMTGVRGVGKTSTARLIAKALNCVGPDGQGGPTIDPCGQCEPCKAIAEGRHIDVVEMDAASHTGVDDVREIIEAVRYAAVSARYKIYIIDEVHMLSKNAFNALLKTLEEPPAHVKFLFATTEVNKVPVTVLSRCQRFDLRRIPAELLATHFTHVVEAERVAAEPEALALIAQADADSMTTKEVNAESVMALSWRLLDFISLLLPNRALLVLSIGRMAIDIWDGAEAFKQEDVEGVMRHAYQALSHLNDAGTSFLGSRVLRRSLRGIPKPPPLPLPEFLLG